MERKWLSGRSSRIPCASRFCKIQVERFKQSLLLYCLYRKDMFYQVKSSEARRDSNVIAGPIPVRDIFASGLSEFVGDEIKEAYARDPSLKASGCLASLGQGDHLACEFV